MLKKILHYVFVSKFSRAVVIGCVFSLTSGIMQAMKLPGQPPQITIDHEDAPSCWTCLESYTPETLVIQFDCGETSSHHLCLPCLYQWTDQASTTWNAEERTYDNPVTCPICRAEVKYYSPYITRALTDEETMHLERIQQRIPASDKPRPAYVLDTKSKKETKSEVKSFLRQSIVGELFTGFIVGWLVSPEFDSFKNQKEKERVLFLRRMLYLPTIVGSILALQKRNPQRIIGQSHIAQWGLGALVGVICAKEYAHNTKKNN